MNRSDANLSPERSAFALRGVVCTAEVLTDAMRATIEQAFGAPCYSQYGCNDAGVSAYECERRAGVHLVTQRAWHEVLADGRLVATELANDAFFLPRYDMGDLVTMAGQPCPCGRGFPLIESVLGRANDLVHDSAGNSVHSEFFTHLLREDTRIAAFQVVYDGHELVVIVQCPQQAPELAAYVAHRRRLAFRRDTVFHQYTIYLYHEWPAGSTTARRVWKKPAPVTLRTGENRRTTPTLFPL